MAAMDHDRRNKQPRMLTDAEKDRLKEFVESIHYSSRCAYLPVLHYCTLADELSLDTQTTYLSIGTYNFLRRW